MSWSTCFQVSGEMSSSNRWYHIRHNGSLPQSDDELSFIACFPFGSWRTQFDHWSSCVPAKKSRSVLEGSMNDVIHLPHMICCHFLAIKPPILWVVCSLQADINLVRTNPEDQDSLLDNGFMMSL